MLRFIFTTLTIPLLVLSSIAQNDELPQYKKWFVGGSFGMDIDNSEDEKPNGVLQRKYFSIRISPSAGYQINRHWLIGISPVYDYSYRENSMQMSNETIAHDYGARIFARYLYSWHPQWHIYLQPYARYHFVSRTYESSYQTPGQSSSTILSLGVLPGISYTIKERIRLITNFGGLSIQHVFGNNRENYQRNSTRFDLNLGLSSFYFGMEYLF